MIIVFRMKLMLMKAPGSSHHHRLNSWERRPGSACMWIPFTQMTNGVSLSNEIWSYYTNNLLGTTRKSQHSWVNISEIVYNLENVQWTDQ